LSLRNIEELIDYTVYSNSCLRHYCCVMLLACVLQALSDPCCQSYLVYACVSVRIFDAKYLEN